jgi:Nuclease-related domain
MRWVASTDAYSVNDREATAPTAAPAAAGVAGQHARATQRRYVNRALGATMLAVVALVLAIVTFGLTWAAVAVEAVVIATIAAVDAKAAPLVDRWGRGADGEERVGRILDGLRENGWLTLHDVQLGRGNVDHVVIGPAGIYTIETKAHRGRINADAIDAGMLTQAYAEAKLVEGITALRVQPLLVFSNAYLTPAVSHRSGVVILPARMLAAHLRRRGGNIPAARVAGVYARLVAAVA